MDRRVEDLGLLRRPEEWPAWPALPVKRYPKNGLRQFGVVFDSETYQHTVFLVNLFELGTEKYRKVSDVMADGNVGRFMYTSFEVMLDDGWMVD